MRKLITITLFLAACVIAARVRYASAAGFSTASVQGSWVCTGTGFVAVKSAKGATSWVPINEIVMSALDGKGKVTSGKTTTNAAGMTCSYSVSDGSYTVNPDGTGTYSATSKADPSNSPKCAPGATLHSSFMAQSDTLSFVVSTDNDATTSFFCQKQSGQ